MVKKWIAVCSLIFVAFSCGGANAFAAVSINSLQKSAYAEKDFDNLGAVTMKTEVDVYGKDVKSISVLIQNNSQEPMTYGTEYVLEAYNNGQWYAVPFKGGYAFNSLAITMAVGDSNAKRITLQHETFNFANGKYRIVKKIGDKLYEARFQLGKSSITAATPYGFLPMEKLPANYTRREAATAGDIVITQQGVMNNDAYAKFLEKVEVGIPAMLRITNVENERKPKVMDIIFDEYFLVREGELADISKTPISEMMYSYLNTEGNNVYFSNYANRKLSAIYGNTDTVRIPLQNESVEGKKAVSKINDAMNRRTEENVSTFKIYSPDRLLNANLEKSPLKFGVSSDSFGISMDLVDEKNIANKITDIHWINNTHFMLTCDTSEEQKYFAVYEAQKINPTLIFSQYGMKAPNHTINMNLKGNS